MGRNSIGLKVFLWILTIVILLLTVIWAARVGTTKVTLPQLYRGLFVEYDDNVAIIYDLRFPRICIAIFGGAAMAVSGLLLQAVMRNPLADPGVLGISSGAGVVASAILLFVPKLFFYTPILSFFGGMVTFLLVYMLAWRKGELSPLRIILVGIAINAMNMGFMTALDGMTAANGVKPPMGISMKTWEDFYIMVGYIIAGLILALILSGRCNLLALEDKTVASLGLNTAANRLVISAVAVLLASICTAVTGPISFLGLIVPHIARLIIGSNHRELVPYSIILGALVFLIADTVGRTIMPPIEISAAIIMAIVGGPFFIFLLKKTGKNYG